MKETQASTRELSAEERAACSAFGVAVAALKGKKSQEAIAQEVGVSQGMIWQWANAKRAIPAARAAAAAAAVDVEDPSAISAEWRATVAQATLVIPKNSGRIDPMVKPYTTAEISDRFRAALRPRVPDFSETSDNSDGTHVIVGSGGSALVYVSRIVDAHLSAGSGELIYDFDEVPLSRAYDAEWMRSQGLKPDRCKVWPVRGDSMLPTIPAGSHVLIDTTSREPKHDRIFAIVTDDGLRLKRLLKESSSSWKIYSDNPMKTSYPTEDFVPGVTAIYGQCRDIATPLPA